MHLFAGQTIQLLYFSTKNKVVVVVVVVQLLSIFFFSLVIFTLKMDYPSETGYLDNSRQTDNSSQFENMEGS